MLKAPSEYLTVFIIISVIFILALVIFITLIVYRYQKNQNEYLKDLENLKAKYENEILQAQLEIQEQTFQNISREIHDNIGQKLTLVKLNLNTLNFSDNKLAVQKTYDSIDLIGEAINDLSDISRSMSSEIVLNNGLIKALEIETTQVQKSGLYKICLGIAGNIDFLDANKELVLFRIVQEALNNIIKHAEASSIKIQLDYGIDTLNLDIIDNGIGFSVEQNDKPGTGLINMKKRAKTLNGKCSIKSSPGAGTTIKIEIPLHETQTTV